MSNAYNLLISEAAELDIRDAFLYYEEQLNQLGQRFQRNVKSAMKRIQKAPFQNQIKYFEVRVEFLTKFPFGIHYVMNKQDIIIVAVFHTSQDPSKWSTRL